MNKLELLEKLRELDETLLLDLLEVTSSEIVDAFLDKIDEKLTYLYKEIEENE
jgi:hypothetical protein